MKWFSLSGIAKEIKKIRWPKGEDLLTNSVQVVIFTAFFALFFLLCQVVVSMLLRLLGAIA
ncbi:MAG: preprotein translocase subunit SecE [Erysipelotrichaceae bacterium]|jgi:preprotein translocase SecE subunit|nr:preprotein translocase subunit SecE [Erysipelotrichaceae bacterium]MBQ1810836.1 preprotein translocase subunit SecE [Erysipelotrichaceae bacterium]MBQ5756114.1 preprotein translocase subunit SecE [Erysipelotrichaceae bacterium]MBR3150722.1 preprotein translocase subunit SecE [Erysipelotrichaceae bacterium]MBR3167696.1 preprotein translocase subunit SecE [Erysipelotrichaceae bacterium]